MKKIFISGGSGFLGKNLIDYILKKELKYEIYVASLNAKNELEKYKKNIKLININFLDQYKTKKIIKKINPDYIINLLGFVNTERNIDIAKIIFEINTIGTINIINSIKDMNFKKIINISSYEVYGENKIPFKETQFPDLNSPYAIAKYANEKLIKFFAEKYKKNFINLRISSIFGPYQDQNKLIPYIIKNIIENKKIELYSPRIEREFLYVDDLSNAIINSLIYKNKSSTINISNSNTININKVIKEVKRILNKKNITIEYKNEKRFKENLIWKSNIKKAKTEINWTPKISFKDGLEKTINWYKNEKKRDNI